MNHNVRKVMITTLMLGTSITCQAMSKPDYGQVNITVKDDQPCFYLSGYTREVELEKDVNKLTYAIVFEGSKDLFIVHNTYLDIPNSPQSCLPISEMEALTSQPTIRLNKPYGIELKLGIRNEYVNGANYVSEFCIIKNNNTYKIVEADRGRVTPNSDEVTNYCTDNELEERKGWFQKLKKWVKGFFYKNT